MSSPLGLYCIGFHLFSLCYVACLVEPVLHHPTTLSGEVTDKQRHRKSQTPCITSSSPKSYFTADNRHINLCMCLWGGLKFIPSLKFQLISLLKLINRAFVKDKQCHFYSFFQVLRFQERCKEKGPEVRKMETSTSRT